MSLVGASLGCGDDTVTSEATSGTATGAGGSTDVGGAGGGTTTPGAVLPCAPGEVLAEDGSCEAPGIGVDECGEGFDHDGDVGCEPIQPVEPCGPGEVALLGETACHPLTDCANPEPAPSGTTHYVDGAFGGVSDGSAQAPWTTVQEAIAGSPSGSVIVIAQGTYAGAVTLTTPRILWGACAEGVTLADGVTVLGSADGTEIHRVSITGPDEGLSLSAASDVVIDHVRIHDTGWWGVTTVDGAGPTTVTLQDVLIENSVAGGIFAEGSEVTLRRTVVRDGLSDGNGDRGFGLFAEPNSMTGRRPTITVEASILKRHHHAALLALGGDVVVDDSLLSEVSPRASDARFGYGIGADRDASTGERASIVFRGSMIEQVFHCGLCSWDSDLAMGRSVVREVTSEASSGDFGRGVQGFDIAAAVTRQSTFSVDRSLVERSQEYGIAAFGVAGSLTKLVVRDVTGRASDGTYGHLVSAQSTFGPKKQAQLELRGLRLQRGVEAGLTLIGTSFDAEGITVQDIEPRPDGLFGAPMVVSHDIVNDIPAAGALRQVVLEGGHTAGLAVLGGDVTASDVEVRGILEEVYAEDFGDGIIASGFIFSPSLYEASLDLLRVTVEGAPRAGLASFSAMVTVGDSDFECNTIHLDAEPVLGGEASIENGGGNRCGCGDEVTECKVLQTGLTPPTPPI